jgi:GAF domain-containing protein
VHYIDSKSVNAFSSQNLHNPNRVAAQISGILANSELRAALERESNERKVLADIGRVISLSLDIDEVYRRFAELVADLIDFDLIQISLLDEHGDRFDNAYTAGHETLRASAQRSAPLEGSFTEQVLLSDAGMILDFRDADNLLRDFPLMQHNLEVGTMSMVAVALVSGDKPIGVMYLHSLSVAAYSDADLEIAQRVSAQISGAIANAQLHADLERESNERRVLSEIDRIISASVDPNEVYGRFAEQVGKLLKSDQIIISNVYQDSGEYINSYLAGPEIPIRAEGEVHELADSFVQHVIRERRGVKVTSTDLSKLMKEYPGTRYSVEFGLRSFIGAPMVVNDQVIGILHVNSYTADAYDDHDVEIVENVALQIAGAVANGDLYRQVQKEARERQTMSEIGRIINSSAEPKEVFAEFAEQVRELLDFDHIVLTHIDEQFGTSTHSYLAGAQPPSRSEGDIYPLAGSFSELVARQRKGIRTTSAALEKIKDEILGSIQAVAFGLQSYIGAPMVVNDRVIGVLHVNSFERDAYDDHDVAIVENIALQIAGAIINGDLYRQVQLEAKERKALSEIGRIINSSAEPQEVFLKFADHVSDLLEYDHIILTHIDVEAGICTNSYKIGGPVPMRSEGDVFPLEGSFSERVANERRGIRATSEDIEKLAIHVPGLRAPVDYGLRTFIGAPMVLNDRVMGVLYVNSFKVDAYD